MKNKTILILVVIFAGLLIAYLVGERPGSDIYQENPENNSTVFPDFDAKQVRTIEITGGKHEVNMIRTEQGWIVTGDTPFPADSLVIDDVLHKVTDMTYSEIVSENKENHSVFEVDDEKGVKVRFLDDKGQPVVSIVTGKNGQSPNVSYVREEGSNVVTLQEGLHRYRFDRSSENWKNRSIMKFDSGSVVNLEISRMAVVITQGEDGETTFATATERLMFSKEGGAWNMIEPEKRPGKKTALDNLATIFSNLTSANIPDQSSTDTGLDNPQAAVAVTLEDNSIHVVRIGSEIPDRKDQFYVQNVDMPYLYAINKYQVDKLKQTIDDLTLEPEPVEVEAGGLEPPAPPDID